MADDRPAALGKDHSDRVEAHGTIGQVATLAKMSGDGGHVNAFDAIDPFLRRRGFLCPQTPRFHLDDDERPAVGINGNKIDLVAAQPKVSVENAIPCLAKMPPGQPFAPSAG